MKKLPLLICVAALCLLPIARALAESFSAELLCEPTNIPTTDAFTVEIIRDVPTQPVSKRVLIYHTHTFEAYEQDPEHAYQPTEKWRTADPTYNMIAVGKALASCLEALGIDVVHDVSTFELPSLDSAYERSLAMLQQRQATGETYDLYLDLHRDAIASSSSIKRTVNIGGEEVARFMVLIGQGSTGGYAEKPNWEANLIFAEKLTDAMNERCPQLARDVKIKTGRFNQHISEGCLLIECGMTDNTLNEVLSGIPYLADAIWETLCN